MDFMKMATGALTPILANKLAGALGLPEGLVRKGLSVALPVLLAAFLKRGASPDGATAIGAALGTMPEDPLSSLGKLLGGSADEVRSVGTSGRDMLTSIFGQGQSAALTDTIAAHVGGDREAVASLLGVAGAGALGSMRKAADDRGLDAVGVMKLLSSQKSEIAAAIPADLARSLAGTGLLPEDVQSAAVSAKAAATPGQSSGWVKWAAVAAALALAAWFLPQFFRGAPDVADNVSALVVDGTDIGTSVEGVLASLTETLSGVTDAASAETALAALTTADGRLADLDAAIGGLTEEGRSALSGLVGGALPDLQETIAGFLGNAEIAALLKPVLDSIMTRLAAMVS